MCQDGQIKTKLKLFVSFALLTVVLSACGYYSASLEKTYYRNGTGGSTSTFSQLMASTALRDANTQVSPSLTQTNTSNQLSLDAEVNSYAGSTGASLPVSSGYNYREVPDTTQDDDGYLGTTCKYASRPSSNCGTSQTTIALRIADCASQNPSTSTWDGASKCNRGQGTWKLVTRSAANKEVWQDQRTGLLWSSNVSTGINWCQAAGNTQLAPVTFTQAYNNSAGTAVIGSGTISNIAGGSSSVSETITVTFTSATAFTVTGTSCTTAGGGTVISGGLTVTPGSTVTWGRTNFCSFTITQGSTNFAVNDKFIIASTDSAFNSCVAGAASGLQPGGAPVSYCVEAAGLNPPGGEVWINGGYVTAKGGMGKLSLPAVTWRLPTIEDYKIADVNGVRMIMPDMGIVGTNRQTPDGSTGYSSGEWSASLSSSNRYNSWYFTSNFGNVGAFSRSFSSYTARCVGR